MYRYVKHYNSQGSKVHQYEKNSKKSAQIEDHQKKLFLTTVLNDF